MLQRAHHVGEDVGRHGGWFRVGVQVARCRGGRCLAVRAKGVSAAALRVREVAEVDCAVVPGEGAPTAAQGQLGADVGEAAGGGEHRTDGAVLELDYRRGAVLGLNVVAVGAAPPRYALCISRPPQHQVDEVHRLVGQRAALGIEPAAPALREAGVVIGLGAIPLHAQVHQQQVADGAAIDGRLDALIQRPVTLLEVDRQQQSARLRLVDRRVARRRGDVHRLGHAHVLAGAQRLHRHPGMRAARGPQADHVDVVAGQQIVVAGDPRHAPGALRLPAALLRQVTHRRQLRTGRLPADLRAPLAHTQSYDCKPDRFRHVLSFDDQLPTVTTGVTTGGVAQSRNRSPTRASTASPVCHSTR